MTTTFFRLILRPQILAVWICATVVAAIAGPFGTFHDDSFWHAFRFWGLVIGISIFVGFGARLFVWRLFPALSRFQTELLGTVVFAIVFCPIVWVIQLAWVGGVRAADFGSHFWELFGSVLLVKGAVSVFVLAFREQALSVSKAAIIGKSYPPPQPDAIATPEQEPEPPALLGRLPTEKRGNILWLCSSDHYVSVVTDLGKTDILMRLADAIDLLGDLEGLRVHRSYWVSRAAVAGQKRSKGRLFLVLHSGEDIPVSRSFRADVEAEFTVPEIVA